LCASGAVIYIVSIVLLYRIGGDAKVLNH
jgi:hypothetical protein